MTEIGSAHGRVAVGHPIDVATGEFFATHVDHELEGVVPLSLGRRFSTNFLSPAVPQQIAPRSRFEPFGPGWRPSWWAELRGALGGGFVYVRADGTEFAISNPPGAQGFAVVGRIVAPEHGLQLEQVDATRIRVVGFGSDGAELGFGSEASRTAPAATAPGSRSSSSGRALTTIGSWHSSERSLAASTSSTTTVADRRHCSRRASNRGIPSPTTELGASSRRSDGSPTGRGDSRRPTSTTRKDG